MAFYSEPNYHFSVKEDTKKFFYVYENIAVRNKTEEEKAGKPVACSDGEAFAYRFNNFTEDNALNDQSRSLQKVTIELLHKFSMKKSEAEVKM